MVVDQTLIWALVLLLLFGWVMVYSASVALSDLPKKAHLSMFHYTFRHAFMVVVGVLLACGAALVPTRRWQAWAPYLFLAGFAMLVLVLIPPMGVERNGARRWFGFGGIGFQPSEAMKLFCVLFAADYVVRKQAFIQEFKRGFLPLAIVVGLVGLLLLLQPDLGAFFVIVCIAMGILFLGGVSGKLFVGLGLTLVATFLTIIWLSPWRRERLFAYIDVWDPKYVEGKGYQLAHSLIAFGRGEWWGVGLGASVEKLNYLPEANTDFIMAVVAEELGFVGVAGVVALFYLIVRRAFDIGRQAIALERYFQGLVAQGVAIWLGIQVFINVGVATGLLPTKGLTLPFISHGGSAIVVNLVAMGILLRIDWETRRMMRGLKV